MSKPPIWGSDIPSAEASAARAAGWSRADLAWEWQTEAGNRTWETGHADRARSYFRRAHLIARLFLPRTDLRQATTLANLAICDLGRGRANAAQRRLRRAVSIWTAGQDDAIADMAIAPRSRSSLFHLRMEALHRDTFHSNMRTRIGRIAAETLETLKTATHNTRPAHRHFSRWKGERPTVYDDTRKVLGACLLLIDR